MNAHLSQTTVQTTSLQLRVSWRFRSGAQQKAVISQERRCCETPQDRPRPWRKMMGRQWIADRQRNCVQETHAAKSWAARLGSGSGRSGTTWPSPSDQRHRRNRSCVHMGGTWAAAAPVRGCSAPCTGHNPEAMECPSQGRTRTWTGAEDWHPGRSWGVHTDGSVDGT